tara:strand:+ start:173 stop:937 length:765 start_codon:yes stop_codon:yes gene_type:complete
MAPVETNLGVLYSLFDPEGFKAAKKHGDEYVTAGMLSKESEGQAYTLEVRVMNNQVEHHNDPDSRKILTATACFGKFEGGNVCIPIIGVRFRQLPGDAVFMRASLTGHCVTHFIGQRSTHVFTSKTDSTSLKHRRDMTPDEQAAFNIAYAAKQARKTTAINKARQQELELIQAYHPVRADISSRHLMIDNPFFPCTLWGYKIAYIHNNPRKLRGSEDQEVGHRAVDFDWRKRQGVTYEVETSFSFLSTWTSRAE